jgi:membrane protein required for colicin V production
MTQFDLLVFGLIGISGFVGFVRGAIREIAAFAALIAAAGIAVFGLPVFAPIFRAIIHPDWLGSVAALVGVFLIAFIALRMIAAGIARQIQSVQILGFLDRSLGLLIGLGRGLIVLGGLYLLFAAATPEDLRPPWITGARTWPTAVRMGEVLRTLAPKGVDLASQLKPALDRAVREGSDDKSATEVYEARDPTRPDPGRPETTR